MTATRTIQFVTSPATQTASGYLVRPAAGRPGLVVVQEWWGLVPHIQDVVGRFADQGYVTLAPDLYHGKKTTDAEEAQHLMQGLDWGRAATEIAGAVRHLRESEGCTHVGVVGFCMGGALAVIAASQPGVDAYVAFYGFPPKGAVDHEKITVPGLLLFGETDEHFSIPEVQAFAAQQNHRNIPTEVVLYPGAGHAFFNDTRPEAYRAPAANEAWRRALALLGKTLRPAQP